MPETAAENEPEIDTSVQHITTNRKVFINLAGIACGVILNHYECGKWSRSVTLSLVSLLIAISSSFILKAIESPESGYRENPIQDTVIRLTKTTATVIFSGTFTRLAEAQIFYLIYK